MELKTKAALAEAAKTLAQSYQLTQHSTTTYVPAHWQTEVLTPAPAPEEAIWIPLDRQSKQELANKKAKVLFATDSEFRSFDYMLQQFSTTSQRHVKEILIRTEDGLRVLTEHGELVESDGKFIPNFIRPVLNTNEGDKAEVFGVISNWLDSEEEAHSLLNHLATSLAPGWSAVKYVLLLGDGRNGKSVLLSMMHDLFGEENVSNVTRQQMISEPATATSLNNKLLNIVFDGRMDYIKDSGLEKTLIAGEPGYVRVLYDSGLTKVQTNALFIEGLQKEPKTRDKSSALQKRIVRFWFPKVFERDLEFEARMRSEKMLGAFLALLIDHYVERDDVVEKLKLTNAAKEMQINQMWQNSPVLQFITHCIATDPAFPSKLVGANVDALVGSFMAWRVNEGFNDFNSADVLLLFKEAFVVDWKTKRDKNKGFTKTRVIKEIKTETMMFLNQLKEGDPGDVPDTEDGDELVGD